MTVFNLNVSWMSVFTSRYQFHIRMKHFTSEWCLSCAFEFFRTKMLLYDWRCTMSLHRGYQFFLWVMSKRPAEKSVMFLKIFVTCLHAYHHKVEGHEWSFKTLKMHFSCKFLFDVLSLVRARMPCTLGMSTTRISHFMILYAFIVHPRHLPIYFYVDACNASYSADPWHSQARLRGSFSSLKFLRL